MKDVEKICLGPENSMKQALNLLHEFGKRIVLVVDENNSLLGTVTDGDIRRALLKGIVMDDAIFEVMNSEPIVARESDSDEKISFLLKNFGLIHIPVVDRNNKLIDIKILEDLFEKRKYDNAIFLLAGGFGKRLHQLTKDLPKPMLKVGEKPILETIIMQFVEQGFNNFFISTHYKAEIIEEYFNNNIESGINISFINEDNPLGTAGPLGNLPDDIPDLPMIVMNADLLTKVNFEHLLDFHLENKMDITVCVKEYDFQVPYGVIKINECRIEGIEEKPSYSFFVNAGIYVLNKRMINKIDGQSYLDMTDFISAELNKSNIGAFPIHEYWLDIGRLEEFKKANQEISSKFVEI